MTKRSTILAALALLGLTSAPALAQTANKTWVSSASGNDSGTCQFVSPCKTFAYAITQTAPGGELDVKDAGSYGIVTITKAISIVSNGVLAAISVPSGDVGVTVNAGDNDNVVLQGLVIDGHGSGKDGIDFNSGSTLSVENCHVRNVSSDGILLAMNASSQYHISDTEVENAGSYGIVVNTIVGPTSGTFSDLNIHGNATGIDVAVSSATLIDSTVSGNGTGLLLVNGGVVFLGNTTVSANTTDGILNQNGTLNSYGNNYINGNKVDTSGTISTVARR